MMLPNLVVHQGGALRRGRSLCRWGLLRLRLHRRGACSSSTPRPHARKDEHDEAVHGDLAQDERPVIREDLVEGTAAELGGCRDAGPATAPAGAACAASWPASASARVRSPRQWRRSPGAPGELVETLMPPVTQPPILVRNLPHGRHPIRVFKRRASPHSMTLARCQVEDPFEGLARVRGDTGNSEGGRQ